MLSASCVSRTAGMYVLVKRHIQNKLPRVSSNEESSNDNGSGSFQNELCMMRRAMASC